MLQAPTGALLPPLAHSDRVPDFDSVGDEFESLKVGQKNLFPKSCDFFAFFIFTNLFVYDIIIKRGFFRAGSEIIKYN